MHTSLIITFTPNMEIDRKKQCDISIKKSIYYYDYWLAGWSHAQAESCDQISVMETNLLSAWI